MLQCPEDALSSLIIHSNCHGFKEGTVPHIDIWERKKTQHTLLQPCFFGERENCIIYAPRYIDWGYSLLMQVLGLFIGQITCHKHAVYILHLYVGICTFVCMCGEREIWFIKLYYNGFGICVLLRNKILSFCSSCYPKSCLDILRGLSWPFCMVCIANLL